MPRLNKTKRRIWTVENGQVTRKADHLATEEPLEILLRAGDEQRTVAITMRTPGNDYELAAGFLHSEGIVEDKLDIVQMTYCTDGSGQMQEYNALRVQLRRDTLPELARLERHFFTNSACGVCGATMLDDLAQRDLPPFQAETVVTPQVLAGLPEALREAQSLFETTGGLHAAALFTVEGQLLALREDVGRHNALDKLIGWGLLSHQIPFDDKVILVSGRASYELLQKCRVAGAPIFCAVSAPSSLAVELAERFGVTLVGFLRGQRFNVYSGIARIKPHDGTARNSALAA
ncbi:MAG: formate dehydrogenase accessory sulfurtransferase FdhD [Caldilineaceae bacterium]|nr:formate dehydrogenase accessory sulfurtransferase FdhD [Caldilineaceae bacterium]